MFNIYFDLNYLVEFSRLCWVSFLNPTYELASPERRYTQSVRLSATFLNPTYDYTLVGEFTVGTRMNREERLIEARLQHAILTH